MTAKAGADPLVRVTVRRLDASPGTGAALSFRALLRVYHDDRLELVGATGHPLPRLTTDERLLVERAVAGDAMYSRPVRVLADVPQGGNEVMVEAEGADTRTQQREFVRVETMPIPVDVRLQDPPDDGRDRVEATMRDISAGGLRVAYPEPQLSRGSLVVVRFELTKEDGRPDPMELRAEVRWSGGDQADDRVASGLMFTGVGRALETRLTGWVFREEAKRLRAARERS